MKKYLIGCFLFFNTVVFAQNNSSFTLNFNNSSIEDVFTKIENQSNYQFYFLKKWLPKEAFSGNFKNASLEEVLDSVFHNTVLNYYLLGNKIIITQNSLVYNDFSRGILYTDSLDEEDEVIKVPKEESSLPVFYEENDNKRIEIVKIGKENNNARIDKRYKISGTITDYDTGAPIENAAIIIENNNIGAVTDSLGNYSINLPQGIYTLKTQSLGNLEERRKLIVYNSGDLNLKLRPNLEMLNEVVIESESDKNVNQPFAGVSEINVREIKTIPLVLGERDLLKVATTLPGISKAGEGSSGYNVRGGRADQNLILLDKGLIYNPNHFFGIFSALNPFTTGSVDIYKGSIPAKYGGRLSSVFDIKTKQGNSREFSGEGSIGPVTGNLALEIPLTKDKSSLIIGGRATYSDWILQNLNEKSLNNSQASFYDFIAKYNLQIDEKSEINATAYHSHDKFSITSDSLYSYQNQMLSLSYDKKINNKVNASIFLTNSNYKFNIDYDSQFDNSFTTGYSINDSKLQLDVDHKINKKNSLNYGLASKYYIVNPGSIEPIGAESIIETKKLREEKGLESALYISDEFTVSKKITVNGGLRFSVYNAIGPDTVNIYEENQPRSASSLTATQVYSNNEFIKTYSGLEYRFSARYFLLPDLSVKAGYSTTLQYIHTLSNNTTVSPTDIYKLADYNIKPQEARQFSIGFFKNFDENNYELSLEGYYKDSNNILDFKTGATLFLNENIETETLQGEGKAYGIEFLLRKNSGKLNGWLSYTYSRSFLKLDSPFSVERVNEGEYFPSNYDKPHDFSAILNYKLTKRFSFSGNLIYQTGRPVTFPIGKYSFNNSEFVVYSDRNQYRIPDYYRLDLSFNAEGNHKIDKLAHSFWSLSVYNVLGRNNPYSVFFVTKDGEVQAYQSSIFSIPIPTITYNFKF